VTFTDCAWAAAGVNVIVRVTASVRPLASARFVVADGAIVRLVPPGATSLAEPEPNTEVLGTVPSTG
jgi:hypothetical protein